VRFLLDHGADPRCKNALAVRVAIRRKDLRLVRMLVERGARAGVGGRGKRLRVEDRVEVGPEMLRVAVKCDARDIVEYLTKEKGCVPDIQTLHLMVHGAG